MRFRFVDRVASWEPGQAARGLQDVAATEGFFQDHFPRKPVLPGVLMLEGLQQLAVALIEDSSLRAGRPVTARLSSLEGVKFREMVTPGDTLQQEVLLLGMAATSAVASARACRGGADAVTCRMTFDLIATDEAVVRARVAGLLKAWGWVEPSAGT